MQFIDLKAQYQALKVQIDQAIHAVLDHGQYIMGPEVAQFESELASYLGVRHVITCANGTDALQMVYLAYGINRGDAVFCPDITFIASVEPACMLGATPVFCDVEPKGYNIDVESLERQIQAVLHEGRLNARAVVTMDFLGNPCDYDAIDAICKKYKLLLIEDAAQSFGSRYRERKCGSLGDVAITSFFPAKPLGCYGDGGAVMTNDESIADVCRSLREHGKGKSKYNNERIGLNSRLDTLQAAILLPKLRALREYEIEARQRVASLYNRAFEEKLKTLKIFEGMVSAYAQYAVLAQNQEQRENIVKSLNANGIPFMIYYPRPQHALPVFEGLYQYGETFENSTDFCDRTFSLPMHPYLDSSEQDRVIQAVLDAI